jgi:hypothetical protein
MHAQRGDAQQIHDNDYQIDRMDAHREGIIRSRQLCTAIFLDSCAYYAHGLRSLPALQTCRWCVPA